MIFNDELSIEELIINFTSNTKLYSDYCNNASHNHNNHNIKEIESFFVTFRTKTNPPIVFTVTTSILLSLAIQNSNINNTDNSNICNVLNNSEYILASQTLAYICKRYHFFHEHYLIILQIIDVFINCTNRILFKTTHPVIVSILSALNSIILVNGYHYYISNDVNIYPQYMNEVFDHYRKYLSINMNHSNNNNIIGINNNLQVHQYMVGIVMMLCETICGSNDLKKLCNAIHCSKSFPSSSSSLTTSDQKSDILLVKLLLDDNVTNILVNVLSNAITFCLSDTTTLHYSTLLVSCWEAAKCWIDFTGSTFNSNMPCEIQLFALTNLNNVWFQSNLIIESIVNYLKLHSDFYNTIRNAIWSSKDYSSITNINNDNDRSIRSSSSTNSGSIHQLKYLESALDVLCALCQSFAIDNNVISDGEVMSADDVSGRNSTKVLDAVSENTMVAYSNLMDSLTLQLATHILPILESLLMPVSNLLFILQDQHILLPIDNSSDVLDYSQATKTTNSVIQPIIDLDILHLEAHMKSIRIMVRYYQIIVSVIRDIISYLLPKSFQIIRNKLLGGECIKSNEQMWTQFVCKLYSYTARAEISFLKMVDKCTDIIQIVNNNYLIGKTDHNNNQILYQQIQSLCHNTAEFLLTTRIEYCKAIENMLHISILLCHETNTLDSHQHPIKFEIDSAIFESFTINNAVDVSKHIEMLSNINEDLQLEEDHMEYRSTLRDLLRELMVESPIHTTRCLLALCSLALQKYTNDINQSYSPTTANPGGSVVVGVGDCTGWSISEARLHALTAISKQIFLCTGSTKSSQSLPANCSNIIDQLSIYQFLQLLLMPLKADDIGMMSVSEVCISCRPLCCMCVILLSDLIPGLHSISMEEDDPTDSLVFNRESASELFGYAMKFMLLSLQHSEYVASSQSFECFTLFYDSSFIVSRSFPADHPNKDAMMRELMLQAICRPFRTKQDHIGCVSLLKLLTSESPSIMNSWSPSLFSLFLATNQFENRDCINLVQLCNGIQEVYEQIEIQINNLKFNSMPSQIPIVSDSVYNLQILSIIQNIVLNAHSFNIHHMKINPIQSKFKQQCTSTNTVSFESCNDLSVDNASKDVQCSSKYVMMSYCLMYLLFIQPVQSLIRPKREHVVLSSKSFSILFHACIRSLAEPTLKNHSDGPHKKLGECRFEIESLLLLIFAAIYGILEKEILPEYMNTINDSNVLFKTAIETHQQNTNQIYDMNDLKFTITLLMNRVTLQQLISIVNEIITVQISSSSFGIHITSASFEICICILNMFNGAISTTNSRDKIDNIGNYMSSSEDQLILINVLTPFELDCVFELLNTMFIAISSQALLDQDIWHYLCQLLSIYLLYLSHYRIISNTCYHGIFIPAKHAITALCRYHSVDTIKRFERLGIIRSTDYLHEFINKVSIYGLQIIQHEMIYGLSYTTINPIHQDDYNMKIDRNKQLTTKPSDSNGEKDRNTSKIFISLLQFWCSCLESTELLFIDANTTTNNNLMRKHSKMSLDELGWDTLNSILLNCYHHLEILSTVASYSSSSSITDIHSDAVSVLDQQKMIHWVCSSCSVTIWRSLLNILILALGPMSASSTEWKEIYTQNHPNSEAAIVIQWLYENNHLHNITRYLWTLLICTGKNNCYYHSNKLSSDRNPAFLIPSELREDILLGIQKLIVNTGSHLSSKCLLQMLTHPSILNIQSLHINKMLATEVKQMTWVQQLLECAEKADWKKFKTSLKIVWR